MENEVSAFTETLELGPYGRAFSGPMEVTHDGKLLLEHQERELRRCAQTKTTQK